MSKIKATKWKSTQFMTSHDFEINFYRDKDLRTVSMHSHDFYELYFFMQGSVGYIVENGHYKLEAGDILLISPTNLHQMDISGTPVYERIVLWLNTKYLFQLSTQNTDLSLCFKISSKHKNHLLRDPILAETLKSYLLNLYTLSKSDKYGDDISCEIYIKAILLNLSKYLKSAKYENTEIESNDIVRKVTDFVNAHLNQSLNLDMLAKEVFISKYYLAHLFKEETGITLYQYIIKKRLILSKRYIEQKLPITEVYSKCGFTDYSNFFRAFKQEYDITPKQYFKLIS